MVNDPHTTRHAETVKQTRWSTSPWFRSPMCAACRRMAAPNVCSHGSTMSAPSSEGHPAPDDGLLESRGQLIREDDVGVEGRRVFSERLPCVHIRRAPSREGEPVQRRPLQAHALPYVSAAMKRKMGTPLTNKNRESLAFTAIRASGKRVSRGVRVGIGIRVFGSILGMGGGGAIRLEIFTATHRARAALSRHGGAHHCELFPQQYPDSFRKKLTPEGFEPPAF